MGKEPRKAANYSVGVGQAAQGIGQRRHPDVLELPEVLQDVVVDFVLGKTHRGSAPAEGERRNVSGGEREGSALPREPGPRQGQPRKTPRVKVPLSAAAQH